MLEEYLAANPSDSFARYGLAMEMVNAGQTESALGEFKRIVSDNPDYTAAYQMWAQTLIRSGNCEEAVPVLKAGIEIAKHTGNSHAAREMETLLDDAEVAN
ncbi:MAG: tetratricopeptide repeat protein [Acidobacteriales bacterium]|nr:tetratricopeptide repeat protein [Terriglobales bacterium]